MNAAQITAARVADRARRSNSGVLSLWLCALCLVVYLPGLLMLPAVDRTEVVWAETTRDMVAREAWLDPLYSGEVHAFRPIGTFWAQGVAAEVAGPEHARDIRVYRAPSILAVTLATLSLFLLSRAIVSNFAAFTAAALFAVAPLTVLVGTLAIAEGLSLLMAVVAMLTLMRAYIAEEAPGAANFVLFQLAFCTAILVNALLVPILIAATLIALSFMDRNFRWLARLKPAWLVAPLAVISIWWLVVRHAQDGTAFAGLDWPEFLAALGGAQDMKLRAMPGTFVLALLLGFLPGAALVGPAADRLWSARREDKLARFLIAWVLGYLVYLEAMSSKPGTYMVQTMFPALAIAVAMLVRDHVEVDGRPRWSAIPWPLLAALFALALLALPYAAVGALPSAPAAILIAFVAVLFYASAVAGRAGRLGSWAALGVAALGLFAITLLAVVLPSIDALWPAQKLQRAVAAACPGASAPTIGALGFREPSGVFTLKLPGAAQSTDALYGANPQIAIVESRWLSRYFVSNAARGGGQNVGAPLGCVNALNVMRGCPLSFAIYQRDPELACNPAPRVDSCLTADNLPALRKACD